MVESQSVKATRTSRTLKTAVAVAISLLVTACGLGFYFNRGQIIDFITAKSFKPSSEIEQVEKAIELTDKGNIIFYASRPVLQGQDEFNESCDSHDDEISVLGCYSDGNIFLYNIKDAELAGVVESTAAHELLHAAWERMSYSEKSEISDYIKDVFSSKNYHDMLDEDLEIYNDDELIEELHSRIGTEIADLPEALERHYAKYFKNQDLVVDYYDNYITPFRELSEAIDEMTDKLEQMSADIDTKTAAYYRATDSLSSEIDEFNRCANTPNCFPTDALFYARRNVLLGEQSALDSMYDELDSLIDEYNGLVEEYNANILRGKALEEAINSNKQEEVLK